jgi:peptidoglycan/LPS O-acetylase OafA/YrhL
MKAKAGSHLGALTAVRFFAAFYVVLSHFGERFLPANWTLALKFFSQGYIGVNFFFVLSGFILVYTYLRETHSGAARVDVRRFWVGRFARIYPVLVVATLWSVPFVLEHVVHESGALKGILKTVIAIGATLTLTHGWYLPSIMDLNSPSWSLSAEGFFYLLFPWLAGKFTSQRDRSLFGWALALWPLAMLSAIFYMIGRPDGIVALNDRAEGAWLGFLLYAPIFRLGEFALGVVLGILLLRGQARVPGWLAWPVALGIIVTLVALPDAMYPMLHNGLIDPLFGLLILALASGESSLERLLSKPWLTLLGEASYSLYILQEPIWRTLNRLGDRLGLATLSPAFLTFYVLSAIGISVLSYRLLEVPTRDALRRWGNGRFSSSLKASPSAHRSGRSSPEGFESRASSEPEPRGFV